MAPRYQRTQRGPARSRSGNIRRIAAEAQPPPTQDSPHALAARFAAAINDGDVAAAVELWLEDASIVQADGTALQGREAIAPVLGALVENQVGFEVDLDRVFVAGNVALGLGRLTMSSHNGDGKRFENASSAVVVYARDGSGRWRIAIDAPWGLPGAKSAEA